MYKHVAIFAIVVFLTSAGWAGAWTVPSTGITKCYDNTGEIVCPSSGQSFYGQNGNFPGQAHTFVDNGETATDQVTGLVWQKTPDGVARNWDAAAAYCTSLSLDNQSDWRLPTQREHLTIVDHARSMPAFAGPLAGTSGKYWSATPYVGYAGPVWYVNFIYGTSEFIDTDTPHYVRCVRGQTLADDTYVAQGNTVVDTITGLVWEKTASAASLSWGEALAYCQNKTVDGYTDWRLPDIMELETLVDYTKVSPAINDTVFVGPVAFYWSSSTLNGLPDLGKYVGFGTGTSANDPKIQTDVSVRCLRNSSSRGVVIAPVSSLLLQ